MFNKAYLQEFFEVLQTLMTSQIPGGSLRMGQQAFFLRGTSLLMAFISCRVLVCRCSRSFWFSTLTLALRIHSVRAASNVPAAA